MGKDNNFAKAVKELLGEKGTLPDAGQPSPQTEPEQPIHTTPGDTSNADSRDSSFRAPMYGGASYSRTNEFSDSVTRITRDTLITGSITSKSNVQMEGQMTGDIESEGDVNVTGKVDGNISGENIRLQNGAVFGDLNGKTDIMLDSAAVVVGNINSENLHSDGRVKGSVKVNGAVALGENAVVYGNITSKSLNVQDGAVLKGNVMITSSRINEEDLFGASQLSGTRELEN